MANQPSSSTSTTKDNHFYLQIIDLLSVAAFTAAVLVFRFLIPKRVKDRAFAFPKPELYSLGVRPLPPGMSANEFQARFLNTDNIIQTAIVKDCGELFRECDTLFDLDRQVKQMEIDLLNVPHVAKQKPGIFSKP